MARKDEGLLVPTTIQIDEQRWVHRANVVFWSVVALTITGVLSICMDFYTINSIKTDWLSLYSNSISLSDSVSSLTCICVTMKLLIAVSYGVYIWALWAFAKVQPTRNEGTCIRNVRTAVIIQFICFLLILFWPFMVSKFSEFLWLLLVVYILLIVAYFMKKNSYRRLKHSELLSDEIRRGAEDLRFAAVSNLNLLFLYLIVPIILIFIMWGQISSIGDIRYAFIAFVTVIGNLKGITNVHSGAAGQMEGAMMACAIVLFFAGLVALIYGLCATGYSLSGWNKIRKALGHTQPTPSGEEPAATNTTISMPNNNIVEETRSVFESDSTTWFQRNKRWVLPTGIASLLTLLGVCVWLISNGGNKNPLELEKPRWEKFVMVTINETSLYKEAERNSPYLMITFPNAETEVESSFLWEDEPKPRGYSTYNYRLQKNAVLPVLEEAELFYKVQVDDYAGIIEAFLPKEYCKEVQPEPINNDVLREVDKSMYRCDYIIESGKYKNLCFTAQEEEMDEAFLSMGVLVEGSLLYPQHCVVWLYNNSSEEIQFDEETEQYTIYKLFYGSHHAFNINGQNTDLLDTHLLSEEIIERIYTALKDDKPESVIATYYFPDASKERLFSFTYKPDGRSTTVHETIAEDENMHITGYTFSPRGDEYVLLAYLGDVYEETGFNSGGIDGRPEVIDVGDYDGNGDMEAVVQDSNDDYEMNEPPYIVYYDKAKKKYERTEPFLLYDVTKEEKNGEITLVQTIGLRTIRYMFDGQELVLLESKTEHVDRIVKTWTCKGLYPDGGMDEKVESVDLDGDGISEGIVFGHNDSRACGYGKDMYIEEIRWNDGHVLGRDEYLGLQSASSFSVLESASFGMHDLLLDEAWLFRWNGTLYEQWLWDGTDFVKTGY